jgi:hypothetical protein
MPFKTLQFDIEDVLNFVAPYGILTNSSVANFKTALSGTANLVASSRGATSVLLCDLMLKISHVISSFHHVKTVEIVKLLFRVYFNEIIE